MSNEVAKLINIMYDYKKKEEVYIKINNKII